MVRIKCFAIIKELIGKEELDIDLADLDSPTLDSLWTHLETTYPKLTGKRQYLRFAKNMSFVSLESEIADGDEIGVIPPVAGG